MIMKRMNKPETKFYKVLAEALALMPTIKFSHHLGEKWKDIQLNFNPTKMLKG